MGDYSSHLTKAPPNNYSDGHSLKHNHGCAFFIPNQYPIGH